MSDASLSLAEPLFQDKAPRWRSRKVVALVLLATGLGCAVLWSQMPSTHPADQQPTINMPLQYMQPATSYQMKSMRPALNYNIHPASNRQSMQQPAQGWQFVQPSRSVMMYAKFPGTDIEIDSKGVKFPIKATCEVGEAGKSCDGTVSNTGVCGKVTFTQTDEATIEIEYKLTGLTPGKHGFHIHEKADFSNGCASAGPHYNPFKATHGSPGDETRHVGDLGNIEPGPDGAATGKMTDKFIKLFGEYTVAGRSMMIHADPDDLGQGDLEGWPEKPPPPAPAQHTKTTGNAGARIACGIIKID